MVYNLLKIKNNMIRNLAVVMGFALLFTVQALAQQDPS